MFKKCLNSLFGTNEDILTHKLSGSFVFTEIRKPKLPYCKTIEL